MSRDIAQMVWMWLAINGGAFVVLAILSYVGSAFALNCLEKLDRRMMPGRESRNDALRRRQR